MSLSPFFYDPSKVRIIFLVLAALLAVGAFILYLARKRSRIRPAASGDVQKPGAPGSIGAAGQFSLFAATGQTLLVMFAILICAGLTLILLPQTTVNRLAEALRLRSVQPAPENQIAFLYLGDEIAGGDFHLRGAIRNITAEPIEKLDAVIRFYSPDGSLLETAITRLDNESITPDGIATFHLRISGYKGQFSSYSVGFKLRNGDAVSYKDMRGTLERQR